MIRVTLTRDIATCHALRRAVFTAEQGVSEADEVDGLDDSALHLLAMLQDRPIGTARLLHKGEVCKIGRVCVLQDARGAGAGAALMQAAIAQAHNLPGVRAAKLGAQLQVIRFYERLGFVAEGPEYLDAGIPHRDMILNLICS